jgi:hypothetical protein
MVDKMKLVHKFWNFLKLVVGVGFLRGMLNIWHNEHHHVLVFQNESFILDVMATMFTILL